MTTTHPRFQNMSASYKRWEEAATFPQQPQAFSLIRSQGARRLLAIICVCLFSVLLAPTAQSQEFYYHTINSHSLTLLGGRTVKLNYEYQISHIRQLKFSGGYVSDKFTADRDQVKANMYFLNGQFQYKLFNFDRVFVNGGFGLGGDYVEARNQIDQNHNEWDLHFVGGFQAEYYLSGGDLALTLDYDIFYMPWSKLYSFLHAPMIGIRKVL